jgi:hypothetical protein
MVPTGFLTTKMIQGGSLALHIRPVASLAQIAERTRDDSRSRKPPGRGDCDDRD